MCGSNETIFTVDLGSSQYISSIFVFESPDDAAHGWFYFSDIKVGDDPDHQSGVNFSTGLS